MDQQNAPQILLSVHDTVTSEQNILEKADTPHGATGTQNSLATRDGAAGVDSDHAPTTIAKSNDGITSSTPNTQTKLESDGLSNGKDASLQTAQKQTSKEPFRGISLDLPGGGLTADFSASHMQFTNRGSMLIQGKKVNNAPSTTAPAVPKTQTPRTPSNISTHQSTKAMSTEEEELSGKVRMMYAIGQEMPRDSSQASLAQKIGLRWQDALDNADSSITPSVSRATSTADLHSQHSGQQTTPDGISLIMREENELAGGVEDWADINSADVDRYGFIIPRTTAPSHSPGAEGSTSPRNSQRLQRISTSLQIASETPRRHNTFRSPPSTVNSRTSTRAVPDGSAVRPATSQSTSATSQRKPSRFRSASNRLPYHSDKRLLADAADMLTRPPTATSSFEQWQTMPGNPFARRKEIEREAKWRKMARPISHKVYGMSFTFDTQDPKLVERTWKGIPDKWRAAAWYAFLSSSAKKHAGCVSDDRLIDLFHDYQNQGSPDDMQIDIDVPRTINGHIMFRRRYRGGQRLLFRVLHAMSLHFALTGYVQGMAALTATLLAYFEEEKAFVMLVRLWELRGLEKLYKAGFGGLMQALEDFERYWLGKGDLAKRLDDLGITPTAYGTKWYLTLFNYSIPFSAQLRVWDVFMLLGDDPSLSSIKTSTDEKDSFRFGTSLDVLHAASAALIDGMRDILLESDFENAMKVLTSWVPIQDEDLFMRVARIEWKLHKRKG